MGRPLSRLHCCWQPAAASCRHRRRARRATALALPQGLRKQLSAHPIVVAVIFFIMIFSGESPSIPGAGRLCCRCLAAPAQPSCGCAVVSSLPALLPCVLSPWPTAARRLLPRQRVLAGALPARLLRVLPHHHQHPHTAACLYRRGHFLHDAARRAAPLHLRRPVWRRGRRGVKLLPHAAGALAASRTAPHGTRCQVPAVHP